MFLNGTLRARRCFDLRSATGTRRKLFGV